MVDDFTAPRRVCARDGARLDALCAELARLAAGLPAEQPETLSPGLGTLLQLASATGDGGGAPGPWAGGLLTLPGSGSVLNLRGPRGDELSLQLDASGRPHLGGWMRRGEHTMESLVFDVFQAAAGWQLRVESLTHKGALDLAEAPQAADLWGASLAAVTLGLVTASSPDLPTCAACATRLDSSTKFCHHCGQPVRPAARKCAQCQATLSDGLRFCPQCGATLAE